MSARVLALVCLAASAARCGERPAPSAALWAPALYSVETTVLLNDAARNHADVSYKIRARLSVAPRAHSDRDVLLQFTLESPKLYLRGKHVNADFMPYDSVWDSYSKTTFYALAKQGLIENAYLDPDEIPDVLNYKKSLISLFQFQALQGEYNETDVSGPCSVLYETISEQVFRKIKRRCAVDGEGLVSEARRVARYSLRGGDAGLSALRAEEMLLLGPAPHGLKARAWHDLSALDAPAAPPTTTPLPAALQQLPAALQQLPAALQPLPLTLAPTDDVDDQQDLSAVLEEHSEALEESEAGAGGGEQHAVAALSVWGAVRAAGEAELLAALQAAPAARLPALCRALGHAATRAAARAADAFLQPAAADPLRGLALHYLAALGRAPAPSAAALQHALRLAERAREPAVAGAALLAAAAAAARLPPAHALALEARDALVKGLARCKDDSCRELRLLALANLRRADTADLLLEHAERGELSAVLALAALPPDALTFARLDRLTAVALDERWPLELRGTALDLLTVRRAAVPAPLARVMHVLYTRGPHELRRVLWQRLAEHEALRGLPAMLAPQLRGWDARAAPGTSLVLQRPLRWEAATWRAELDSLQLAARGMLRRGTVRLYASDQHNNTIDALTVEVWTRGLEAFGGGADGADGPGEGPGQGADGEEAEGGLALTVGGARLPAITLFRGQAELLSHVWAGTASAPTSVLRAELPLWRRAAALPLLGGATLRARLDGAAALALDAQAQVSLWWRSARAGLELRAAALGELRAHVRTAWSRLSAHVRGSAAPRLRIAADLDFYSHVALCVRVRSEAHSVSRSLRLHSSGGARRLAVSRRRSTRWLRPGHTLSLGPHNDRTCRTLRATDDDEQHADQ